MAQGLITLTHLSDIASAIRAKLGVQTQYNPPQMAAAIASIPTVSVYVDGDTIYITGDGVSVQNDTLILGGDEA